MRGWAPTLILPTNLPEFPPALRREGPSIIAEFHDPTNHFEAMIPYNRDVALFESGSYEQAVEAFGATLEIRPDHELALYNKIVALAKQGKEEAAAEHFHQGWRDRERLSHKGALLVQFAEGPREESEE